MTETTFVNITAVRESPFNVRKKFGDLTELAESIGMHGILQPILVRPINGAKYECVFGHRRLRAAKVAGLEKVPAQVREMSDTEAMEVMLIENIQRVDVEPLEEADAYQAILEMGIMTAEDIAVKVGKSRSHVYGRLKLCELSPAGRTALQDGKLTASVALLVARLPTPDLQKEALGTLLRDGWDYPLSFRRSSELLDRFLLVLRDAPFDTKDGELVQAAGPCDTCPKRTGAQRDLFPEVKSGNVCTDRPCYELKVAAHGKRLVAQARAEGLVVLEGRAAQKARYGSGYVNPDDRCWDDPKQRTYKQLLGKKAPDPVVLVLESGEVRERLDAKKVAAALKEAGHTKAATRRVSEDAHTRRLRERQERARKVKSAMMEALVAAITSGVRGVELWRAVARCAVDTAWADVRNATARRRGIEAKGNHDATVALRKLAVGLEYEEAQALVVELLLGHELHSDTLLRQCCVAADVDVRKVVAKVVAEARAKRITKGAKKKGKPTKAKNPKRTKRKGVTEEALELEDAAGEAAYGATA